MRNIITFLVEFVTTFASFDNNFPGEILENVQINQSGVTAGESFSFSFSLPLASSYTNYCSL